MPSTARSPRRRRVLGLDPEQRQAERRRLILRAALELFGTQGFVRTSIEALCQSAGVGTNSFYELFASKEEVLAELYAGLTDALLDAVSSSYIAHRSDEEPIEQLVSAFVHGVVDDPRIAQVLFVEAEGVGAAVEERRRSARSKFATGLEAVGRDLRDAALGFPAEHISERPGPAPRRNAVAIVGAIVEMTMDWLHDPQQDPVEDLIADVAYHCRRLLRAIVNDTRGASSLPGDGRGPRHQGPPASLTDQ